MADEARKKSEDSALAPTKLNQVTKENAHLVDFDSLEIYLLCLAEDSDSFEMISSYLVRRGWKVEIKNTVKETLKSIAAAKPDFVLVSVNLRHPKILQLPKLIQDTMSIPTIAFAESTEAFAIQQMQKTTAEHKLNGFVSGPMVQRKVRQILQDMYDQGHITSPEWGSSLETESASSDEKQKKIKSSQTMIFQSDKSHLQNSKSFSLVQSVGGKYGETAIVDRVEKTGSAFSAVETGPDSKEYSAKQEAAKGKEYSLKQSEGGSDAKSVRQTTPEQKAHSAIGQAERLESRVRSKNPELKYSILETGPAAVRSPKVTLSLIHI